MITDLIDCILLVNSHSLGYLPVRLKTFKLSAWYNLARLLELHD